MRVSRTIYSHYAQARCHDFDPASPIPHTAILEIEMEEPKIMQIGSYSPSSACNAKVLNPDGICPTLLDHKGAEPAILTPIRTEEQRKLRKQGIDTFGGRQLVPRTDGISNTITTVQKDNLLQEPRILSYTRDDNGKVQSYHEKDIANTIHTSTGQGGNTDMFVKEFTIVQRPHGFFDGGETDIAPTIKASAYADNNFVKEQVIGSMQANAMRGSIDGVSPCLTEAMGTGGGQIPMITERVSRRVNIAYKEMPNGNIRAYDASTPDKRGISELQITHPDNVTPILTTAHEPKVLVRYRIRKLTPRECFRLMDVDDADIDKIDAYRINTTLKNGTVKEKPIPKSQKYKMAGNSIVVSCLYHIFYQMFIAEPPKPKPIQKSLFDQ